MPKSCHRPSTSVRALLAAAAVAATVSTAAFIDHLAVGYASAGHLAAKAQTLIVAAKR
jgi:hypothetical protein